MKCANSRKAVCANVLLFASFILPFSMPNQRYPSRATYWLNYRATFDPGSSYFIRGSLSIFLYCHRCGPWLICSAPCAANSFDFKVVMQAPSVIDFFVIQPIPFYFGSFSDRFQSFDWWNRFWFHLLETRHHESKHDATTTWK